MPIVAAVAIGSLLGVAGLLVVDHALDRPPEDVWVEHGGGLWGDRFPNIEVQTHDGRTLRFYDDLIKGKTVALNFMYVGCKNF